MTHSQEHKGWTILVSVSLDGPRLYRPEIGVREPGRTRQDQNPMPIPHTGIYPSEAEALEAGIRAGREWVDRQQ
jgi:hypothetical protein